MSHLRAGPSPQNDAFLEFAPEERKERKEDRREDKGQRFDFVVKPAPWSRATRADDLTWQPTTRDVFASAAPPRVRAPSRKLPDFRQRATTLRVWLLLHVGGQLVRMRASVARMSAEAGPLSSAARANSMLVVRKLAEGLRYTANAVGDTAEAVRDTAVWLIELSRANIRSSRSAALTSRPVLSFICGIAIGGLVVSVLGYASHQGENTSSSALVETQSAAANQSSAPARSVADPLVIPTSVAAPLAIPASVAAPLAIPAVGLSPRGRAITNDSRRPRVQRAVRDAKPGSETRELPVVPSAAPFRGSLSVSSSPAGAEVTMNGHPVGTTPLLLSNVPAGSRVVQVRLDGYQAWSSGVRVVADERTSVKATLIRR
jgi:hypothetical protein